MSKPLILLADENEEYLRPIELKIFHEIGKYADVEIITDREYFDEYFSVARTADILLVSEKFYSKKIAEHNIGNIFVMRDADKNDLIESNSNRIHSVYKYTSVKEIYDEMIYVYGNRFGENRKKRESQIILIYSPVGGCGKTTVALNLARCLEENHRKVLFVDAEYFQTFQGLLRDKTPIPSEYTHYLYQNEENLYKKIKPCIRREVFDYIPPLRGALSSLGVDFSIFRRILEEVKAVQEYDYIIVDTDTAYSEEKVQLIDCADKVLLIMEEDESYRYKTDLLLNNLNVKDKEKYLFICNRYVEYKDSDKISDVSSKYMVSGYIREQPYIRQNRTGQVLKLEDINKLIYLLN